jgi:hypothetical protein
VKVPQNAGGVLFAIDQRSNPDTIVFCPGGRHGNSVILCGMIGTVSPTPISRRLYKELVMAFSGAFQRQREFLIGQEAAQLWKAGVRLTVGALSPRRFDLRL